MVAIMRQPWREDQSSRYLRVLQLNAQLNRTVVAAVDLAQDGCAFDLLSNAIGDQEVVDAPAGVVLASVEAVAPPAVSAGHVGMAIPKCIGKACVQQLSKAFSLLIREACVLPVRRWVLKVNLVVSNVKITAGNYWFLLRQLSQKLTIVLIPLKTLIQARKLVF